MKGKIPEKKVKEESEFEHIAETYKQYFDILKEFPSSTKQEQQDFLEGFGRDMNTLLKILYEWIHRNDNKGN